MAVSLAAAPFPAAAVELGGTPYAAAARQHDVSPRLLYAVALAETRRAADQPNRIQPWPWVIRTPAGARWFGSRHTAQQALKQAVDRYSSYQVDVGACQINLGWQADRYDDPAALLKHSKNVSVGAAVLADALTSTDDRELAVGRYHTWSNDSRAREYGSWVLAVARALQGRQQPDGTAKGGAPWTTATPSKPTASTSTN